MGHDPEFVLVDANTVQSAQHYLLCAGALQGDPEERIFMLLEPSQTHRVRRSFLRRIADSAGEGSTHLSAGQFFGSKTLSELLSCLDHYCVAGIQARPGHSATLTPRHFAE